MKISVHQPGDAGWHILSVILRAGTLSFYNFIDASFCFQISTNDVWLKFGLFLLRLIHDDFSLFTFSMSLASDGISSFCRFCDGYWILTLTESSGLWIMHATFFHCLHWQRSIPGFSSVLPPLVTKFHAMISISQHLLYLPRISRYINILDIICLSYLIKFLKILISMVNLIQLFLHTACYLCY